MIMKNLAVRSKYRIAICIWLIGGSVFLIGTIYLTNYFLITLLALFATVGIYTLSLKCPNCGKRVLYNPVRILGKEFYIWTSWIPKKCTRCSRNLR